MMNRKHFIKGAVATGIVFFGTATTYEMIRLSKKPDIKYLQSKKLLIAELAETIIPETDTPGAKTAGVEEYIINAVSTNLSRKEQNSFIQGLRQLDEQCLEQYQIPYEKCSTDKKNSILSEFQNDHLLPNYNIARKIEKKLRGRPFFTILKELTIIGYCTSEVGATKGLAYDLVPMNYEPCIPLQTNQKAWATK